MKELIEELYNICQTNSKEELEKNKELFQKFYYQFKGIVKIDEKVYLIFKTILNNPKLINTEYCISEIIDFIRYNQEKVCWQNSQKKETTIDDVNNMLKELEKYNSILAIITAPDYNSLNSINQSSIEYYKNSEIFTYYTDALTRILSTNYLLFSKEKCDEIMNLIYNSKWLNKIIEGTKKNSMLDRDLIYKYISRMLPIKEFISSENIKDDTLIKAITTGKIKDKKLILTLIKELSPIKIIDMFDDNIDNILEFILTIDYINETDKLTILNNIIEKCTTEDYYFIILGILESKYKDNKLVSLALTEKVKEKVIFYTKNDSLIDEEDIDYLLNQNILEVNFISNIMNLYRDKYKDKLIKKGLLEEKHFQIEIKEEDSEDQLKKKIALYNITGRTIDYNLAINLLNKYFNKEITIEIEEMKAIVRSIITKKLKDVGINYKVLFTESSYTNGSCNSNHNYISINNRLIRNFLSKENISEKDYHLFTTMFHEMRHAIQNNNIKNNNYDYNTYIMLKEKIISGYDSNYYDSNYKMYLMEIDAREGGLKDSLAFFKQTFPNIAPKLQEIHDRDIEQYEYKDYYKKEFTITKKEEIIDKIFDRIVALHPEILEKYPILKLEYNEKGLPREYNEINQMKDYNPEIIANILKNRFTEDEEHQNKKVSQH